MATDETGSERVWGGSRIGRLYTIHVSEETSGSILQEFLGSSSSQPQCAEIQMISPCACQRRRAPPSGWGQSPPCSKARWSAVPRLTTSVLSFLALQAKKKRNRYLYGGQATEKSASALWRACGIGNVGCPCHGSIAVCHPSAPYAARVSAGASSHGLDEAAVLDVQLAVRQGCRREAFRYHAIGFCHWRVWVFSMCRVEYEHRRATLHLCRVPFTAVSGRLCILLPAMCRTRTCRRTCT